MIELFLDYESRAPFSPSEKGLWNYANSPLMEPLFLWYRPAVWTKANDYKWLEEPKCWRIWEKEPIPEDLVEYFKDSEVKLVAFNSAFERYLTQYKVGYTIPASRFLDPQVYGRYLSLPASLDVQGQVLELPDHLSKMKRGKELVKLFCSPVIIKATKKRVASQYYNDWNSHPTQWQEFLDYGCQDVIAEAELLRRERILGAYPLPPMEQELWLLDQKINDRGMPLDVSFAKKMYNLALKAKAEAKLNFEKITGIENANSPAQIKVWASTQGYPYPSINKDVVASALKDPNLKLTDMCRAALKMRAEAASTSYQKLGRMLECVSQDGTLKGQFVFLGSARCGRWTGNAVQLQNMARPGKVGGFDFEDQSVVREARALVHGEKYDEIKAKYGSVLLVVKSLIRTAFVAP